MWLLRSLRVTSLCVWMPVTAWDGPVAALCRANTGLQALPLASRCRSSARRRSPSSCRPAPVSFPPGGLAIPPVDVLTAPEQAASCSGLSKSLPRGSFQTAGGLRSGHHISTTRVAWLHQRIKRATELPSWRLLLHINAQRPSLVFRSRCSACSLACSMACSTPCLLQGLFYTVWPVDEHMYPR